LIEDEIDHETVDSSIVTSSEPSKYPGADYVFVVVLIESSSRSIRVLCYDPTCDF